MRFFKPYEITETTEFSYRKQTIGVLGSFMAFAVGIGVAEVPLIAPLMGQEAGALPALRVGIGIAATVLGGYGVIRAIEYGDLQIHEEGAQLTLPLEETEA